MHTHIIGRAVALVAGVIFTAGALAILIEEVILGSAPFGLKHALTITIMSGTMLTGHLVVEAWRSRHVLGALGFAVLFLTGTALVVYKSTGRQAEHTFQSQAEADQAAESRAALKAALGRSEAMLADAQRDLARECKSGRGKRCQGIEATIGVYEAAIKGHRADLDRLGPPKPVAPEAENFAALAAVFGADKAKVKAASLLVVPFIQTVLFELGGIWCLGFAFRHRAQIARAPASEGVNLQRNQDSATRPAWQPTATETAQTSFAHPMLLATGGVTDCNALPREVLPFPRRKPGNPGDGGNCGNPKPDNPRNAGPHSGRTFSKAEAERDIVTLLATGATVDEQNDLADRWTVNKGTVSKWLRDWREQGLVPAAQRVGRCHVLRATQREPA